MNKIIKSALSFLIVFVVFMITSCVNTKQTVLENFFKTLNIPAETSTDLNLKTSYSYANKNVTVKWTSSNENAISNTGVVTRLDTDQTVILVGEASTSNEKLKKSFVIKVLADTSMATLEKVASSLILPTTLDDSINLPSKKTADGKEVTIVWTSSHPDIMDSTGKLTLPKEETTITITAILYLDSNMLEKSFDIIIPQAPDYSPVNYWHKAPLFLETINNEIFPGRLSEFAGAIYRKCVSSRDYWLGIEVVVTLPEFIPDEKRKGVSPYDSSAYRYLDNASIYLGGNSSAESDVGLTWSVGANFAGTAVNYSESIAYRPFWRYIDSGKNTYMNAAWRDTCYYYYPGDTIRMSVFSTKANYLQLRIELLEETTIPKYAQRRANYNLGSNYSKVFVSPEFPSKGMGVNKAEFKRVVALDQVGNEGKPTQPTNAQNANCIFREVYLYREINNQIYKVPMTTQRFAYCNAPSSFSNAHIVSYDGVDKNLGGEIITLSPNNND